MIEGARTAVYLGAGIAAAVAAVALLLPALDEPPRPAPPAGSDPAAKALFYDEAPALAGIAGYINTSPEELAAEIEGRVVLYDIWTYSCINCIRTLPYITAWDDKYADDGLLIIGVHTPEFEFEKDQANVQRAVDKHGIGYPVVLDNDRETWDAFENRYWPRKYIADHDGFVRYDHIGEGAYGETERVIQELLGERARALGAGGPSGGLVDLYEHEHASGTPELYLGYAFAYGRDQLGNREGFAPGATVEYEVPAEREPNHFYMGGSWVNTRDGMRLASDSGEIRLEYRAKEVNIVAGGDATLTVELDGEPVPPEHAGADVGPGGEVATGEHRLYRLVSSDGPAWRDLHVRAEGAGLEVFTFTFG